eukprot:tig00000254_g22587.t1
MAPTGKLIVRVVEARDVPAKDSGGTSDPYVKVLFGAEERKTQVIEKTLRPKWSAAFDFAVRDDKVRKLRFEMFDKNKVFKDEYMGEVEVDIDTLLAGGSARSAWYPMQDKSRGRAGELLLELEFLPDVRRSSEAGSTGTLGTAASARPVPTGRGWLRVKLLEGRGLAAKDLNGLSDPFCILHYAGAQKKSKVIDKNLNPVWNEDFDFPVERADRIGSLKVVMFDQDKLKNDYMGEVTVDLANLLKYEGYHLTHEFQLGHGPEPEYRDEEVKGTLRLGLTFVPDGAPPAAQPQPQQPHAAPQSQPSYQTQTQASYGQAAYSQPSSTAGYTQPAATSATSSYSQQGYGASASSYGAYGQPAAPAVGAGGPTEGNLVVTVVRGRGLVSRDMNGKSDPYCIVSFKGVEKKSSVKNKTLDPDWNESITYENIRSEDLRALKVTIFDKDFIGRDEYMGEVQLDLAAMQIAQRPDGVTVENQVVAGPENRGEKVSGTLTLGVRYEPKRAAAVAGPVPGDASRSQLAAAPAAPRGPIYGTLSVAVLETRDVLASRGPDARAWGVYTTAEYKAPPPPQAVGYPPQPAPAYPPQTGRIGRAGPTEAVAIFEDIFSFPVVERFGVLRLVVSGAYRGRDGRDAAEYLGEASVDPNALPLFQQARVDSWFPLASSDQRVRATGHVHLAISFSPGQPPPPGAQPAAAAAVGPGLTGTLDVEVVQARGLRVADINGYADPYVLLSLGREASQTRVQPNTLSPVWNERFSYRLQNNAEPLLIRVMDRDALKKDDYLGEARVSLGDLLSREPRTERWIPLSSSTRGLAVSGEILLRFSFRPDAAAYPAAAPYPQQPYPQQPYPSGYPPYSDAQRQFAPAYPPAYGYPPAGGAYAMPSLPPLPRGEPKGTLRVEVFEGRGFLPVERDRVPRTLAIMLRHGEFCSRTEALPVGTPTEQRLAWYQAVDFDVYSVPLDGVLHLQALESIMGGPEQTIGEAAVALSRLALDAGDRKVEQWASLFSLRKDAVIGECRVSLAFAPRYPPAGGPGVASRGVPQALYPPSSYPPTGEPAFPGGQAAAYPPLRSDPYGDSYGYPYPREQPRVREAERAQPILPPSLAALPAYREFLRIDPSPIVQTSGKPVGGRDAKVDPTVVLDVGGTEFKVDPAIFRRYPDSLLYRLLCEAPDENRDANGNKKPSGKHVFFDRNPRYFALLLDFCREGHVVVRRDVSLEGVKAEARYFDLYKYMFPAALGADGAARDAAPAARDPNEPLRHPAVSSSTPGVVRFSRGHTRTVTPARPAEFYVRPNEILQIARCKGRGILLVNVYDADGLLRVRRGVVHDASMHPSGEATAATVKDGVWTYPGEYRYEFFLDGYIDDTEALRRQAWVGQCSKCLRGTVDSTGQCDRCDFVTDVSHKTGGAGAAARRPRGPGVPADTMEVEFRLLYHFTDADDVMLHVAGSQPGGRLERGEAARLAERERERHEREGRHGRHHHSQHHHRGHHLHSRGRARSRSRSRSRSSGSSSWSEGEDERERALRARERALRRAEARLARRMARNPFAAAEVAAEVGYPYGSSSRRRRGGRHGSSSRSTSPSSTSASSSSRTASSTSRSERGRALAAAAAVAAGAPEWAPYGTTPASALRLREAAAEKLQRKLKKKAKRRSSSRSRAEAAALALQTQMQQMQMQGPYPAPSSLAQPMYGASATGRGGADAAERLARMAARMDSAQHAQLMTIMQVRD